MSPVNKKLKGNVLVVARDFETFKRLADKRKDKTTVHHELQGAFYTTEGKCYRYIHDVRDMVGHRQCDVEFWEGSEEREDYVRLFSQAKIARQR